MTGFLIRRLMQSIVVLAVLSFLIFCLMALMPGDPIDVLMATTPQMTSADVERLKALAGLDRPIWDRYLTWLRAALTGDFGYSRLYAIPVSEVLLPRLGATLILLGASVTLAIAIAIPLGVAAARRPHGILDYVINLGCFAGISVPPFWLGILMILLFAATLGWLPAGGMGRPDMDLGQRAIYLVLPVATLTLLNIGGFTRFLRASMLEALRQDHIRTARAKGLSEDRIAWGHALRNAALPLVTVLGLSFGSLFSGALITETVFAFPGMGKLIYDAILASDYNLAMLALMLATLVTLVGNFLADLAYAAIDPRVRFSDLAEETR